MPNHGKYPLRQQSPNRALVHGSFTTVNGGNPTATSGQGWSVVRTAEGRWTVTLDETAVAIETIVVSAAREALPGSNTNELVQTFVDQDTIDTGAGASFEIQSYLLDDVSGASAPALDDAPGARIDFIAIVRDTSYA